MLDTALAALSAPLNQLLASDPASRQQLARLGQVHLQVRVDELPSTPLSVRLDEGQVSLALETGETPVDISISGASSRFVAWLGHGRDRSALLASGLQLQGDSGTLQALNDALQELEIDWEYLLGKALGPVPAQLLAQSLKIQIAAAGDKLERLKQVQQDYLREESGLVPHPGAVEAQKRQIRALQLDSERLEARLELLEAKAKDKGSET